MTVNLTRAVAALDEVTQVRSRGHLTDSGQAEGTSRSYAFLEQQQEDAGKRLLLSDVDGIPSKWIRIITEINQRLPPCRLTIRFREHHLLLLLHLRHRPLHRRHPQQIKEW